MSYDPDSDCNTFEDWMEEICKIAGRNIRNANYDFREAFMYEKEPREVVIDLKEYYYDLADMDLPI